MVFCCCCFKWILLYIHAYILVCFVGFCRQYWFQIPLHLNGFKYFIPFFLFQPFLSVLKIIFLLKGPTLVNIQLLNRWLLFCFTFLNSLETLSCDSSVGCRGGLLWWCPVCRIIWTVVFWSISDFGANASSCFSWSFWVAMVTTANSNERVFQ